MHCVLGGSGGSLPKGNLDYERSSEAVGDYTVTTQNQAIDPMFISWSPFPSELAFAFEALPQNCLLGAADLSALCLQDIKQ